MRNKIIMLFALVVMGNMAFAQNTVNVNLLSGEWLAQENNINYSLNFLTATTVTFKENGVENTYTFTVTNDVLIFNSRNFTILELTATSLKIEEVGATSGIINFNKSHKFLPPIPPSTNEE